MSYPGRCCTSRQCHVCKRKENDFVGPEVFTKVTIGKHNVVVLCSNCIDEFYQLKFSAEDHILEKMKDKIVVCKSQLQVNRIYEFYTLEGIRRGRLLFLGKRCLVYTYYDIDRDEDVEVWSDYWHSLTKSGGVPTGIITRVEE